MTQIIEYAVVPAIIIMAFALMAAHMQRHKRMEALMRQYIRTAKDQTNLLYSIIKNGNAGKEGAPHGKNKAM
jgi:hypothetical protein